MQHLLPNLPKPMAPVARRPFLEWVVRFLARQGIRRVVLSTGHLAETIESHFKSQIEHGVKVRCVPETTPLGTAGGFLNAVRASGETPAAWLVLNGDSLALAPLRPMVDLLANPQMAGVILGVRVTDASRYGTIAFDAKGNLQRFEEKKAGAGVINAGVYLLRHAALDDFAPQRPLSFEREVFPSMLTRRQGLCVCIADAPFLDIGTPESLPQAEAFIRQNMGQFA